MALTTIPTFTPSGYAQFTARSYSIAIALPAGSTPDKVLVTNIGSEAAMVLLTTAAATTTGTATAGSNSITVASAAGIVQGQVAVGAGIQPGAFVTGISGTTVTLSQPTTAPLSGTSIAFLTPISLAAAPGIAVLPGQQLALAYGSNTHIMAISIAGNAGNSVLNIAVGV